MLAEKSPPPSTTLTETGITTWSTSTSSAITSSIGSSDTNFDVASLISETNTNSNGCELTNAEIEWLRLSREFTSNEPVFKPPKKNHKVVRKLQVLVPKRAFGWKTLRRRLNGREDVKNILAEREAEKIAEKEQETSNK